MERVLLDTHSLVWWFGEPEKLSARALATLEDGETEVYVSAVSAMEIATKYRLGKLPGARLLAERFVPEVEAEGFQPLPLHASHGQLGGSLAIAHKDPFDRMLIAQSMTEQLKLVSNERLFDDFGVQRLW